MALRWFHTGDGDECTRVTMSTGEWLCIAHGRPVRYERSIDDVVRNQRVTPRTKPFTATLDGEAVAVTPVEQLTVAGLLDEVYRPTVEQALQENREVEANAAVMTEQATLRQVGWYCAEHYCEATSMLQDRSPHVATTVKRIDEVHCEHAVPVFTLVKPTWMSQGMTHARIDTRTSPDWEWVRSLIGQQVVVRFHKDKEPLTGELTGLDDEDVYIRRDVHGQWLTARSGVSSIEVAE